MTWLLHDKGLATEATGMIEHDQSLSRSRPKEEAADL
jgi:hypothetical protein